mgnify:FL=1
MHRAARSVCIALVLAATLVSPLPARAARCGARGHGYAEALEAKAQARAEARAAARRAAAREREERYQRRWVRRWTRAYGSRVGRWADDAIRAGWPDAQLWTLGRIIRAESGGDPRAYNPSGCAGLLQLSRYWYAGRWRFDPYSPELNLRYGLRVWKLCGWRAWVTW